MKLVSFVAKEQASFGIWTEQGIIDLGRRVPRYSRLDELVAAQDLAAARAALSASPDHAHKEVRLEKPLLDWGKCFCVGVNYPARNQEYKDGSAAPAYPSLFVRFPESFTGPEAPLLRPRESRELDYEGEVAVVIGKRGRRIPEARWAEHVFGYMIANEGSVRDWIRHGKFNVTPGKNWPRSGSLGPWITTLDALPPGPMHITTRVNSEVRQDDSTARMLFPIPRILEYISTFCTLEPGDLILTGTPSGAGARLDPPRFLAAGDSVEVAVTGLGTLRNTVVEEK